MDERWVDQEVHAGGSRLARTIVGAVLAVALVAVVGAAVRRNHDVESKTVTRTASSSGTVTASEPDRAGPTTEQTTTTTRPPGPESMTLAFAGDLLPHGPLNRRAAVYGQSSGKRYDYVPMLAPMAPVLGSATLAICHMEVPLAPDQDAITSYPSFGAPSELVDAVAEVGYDDCSNASNHSLDRGMAGVTSTLDRFDEVGLHHAGTARTAEEGAAVTTYEVDGAQVAHLSYAYGFNGYQLPADAPFAADQIDPDRIRADAAAARAGGADLIVVSLHWGNEYQHEPSGYQREVAAAVAGSPDVDVIIGHHAHVVQPIEVVDGTYVVWGLGNQLANQAQVPRSDGLTVVLHAGQRPDGRYGVEGIEAIPTYVEAGTTFRVLPIVDTLADPNLPAGLRATLEASYDRTADVLASVPTGGIILAPRP